MVQVFDNPLWNSKTIGAVRRVMLLPCSVPQSVYVETAVPAAMRAFASLTGPDPRHYYHKAFGRSALCEVKTGVNNALEMGGIEGGIGKRFAFQIAELADLSTWWLFLASVAGDFIYDWASGVYRMGKCNQSHNPNRHSGDNPFGATFDKGIWGGFDWSENSPTSPAFVATMVLAPGETCIIAVSAKGKDLTGLPAPLSTRIVVDNGAQVLDQHEGEEIFGPTGSEGFRNSRTFASYQNPRHATGLTTVGWQCTCTKQLPDGECFPDGGTAFIMKF